MKIGGPNGASSAGAVGRGRPATGGQGFVPTEAAEGSAPTDQASRLESLEGVITLSALLALQGVDDPLLRRRRMVGRAGRILDLLDELKLALIDGEASPAVLDQLLVARPRKIRAWMRCWIRLKRARPLSWPRSVARAPPERNPSLETSSIEPFERFAISAALG
jgi:hypothetical protein